MTHPEGEDSRSGFWIERCHTRLVLGGSLTAAEAQPWRSAVLARAAAPVCTLDLGDLDLEDGLAVVEALNLVIALRDRHGPLVLREAPQMLAHTLYKVGALGNGISLEAPRTDVGTTAN